MTHYFNLFVVAFISATIFPMGSEALLIYEIVQGYDIVWLIVFATLGNTSGSVVNYYMGLKGEEYLVSKKVLKQSTITKATVYFNKWGSYSLLLSWLPIIGDPLTFVAGVLKYDFKKFFILVLAAKASRYIVLAYFI